MLDWIYYIDPGIEIFSIFGIIYLITGIYFLIQKWRKYSMDIIISIFEICVSKIKIWYYRRNLRRIIKKMEKERRLAEERKKKEWQSDLDWINHRK